MGRDVALYAKIRWRMMLNSLTKGRGQLFGTIVAALAIGGFSLFTTVGMGVLGSLEKAPGIRESALLFDFIFILGFIFALFASIKLAFGSFFGGLDTSIWLAAPVSVRSIFVGRFLSILVPSLTLFYIVILPGAIALGIKSHAYAMYFALFAPVALLFFLMPASLGTLMIFSVVRVVSPKRIKEAFAALSAFFGFLIAGSNILFTNFVSGHPPSSVATSNSFIHFSFLPSSWVTDVLARASVGNVGGALYPGALLIVLSSGLLGVALVVAERTYLVGFSNIAGEVPRKSRGRRRESKPAVLLSNPIASIVVKDLKMLFRDAEEWLQFIMPIAFTAFIVVTGGGMRFGMPNASSSFFIPYAVLLATSVANRLALTGIGRERSAVWVLLQSPLPRRQIVIAKIIVAFLPAVASALTIYTMCCLIVGYPSLYLLMGVFALPGLIAGMTALSSIFGALYPNLRAQSAKDLAKGTHGWLDLLLQMAYVLFLVGMAALPQLGLLIGINTAILWAASLVVFYAAVAGSSFIFIAIASKFLERLEVNA